MSSLSRILSGGIPYLWEGEDNPTPEMDEELRNRLAAEKESRDNQPSLSSVFGGGIGNLLSSAKNAYFPARDQGQIQEQKDIVNRVTDPYTDPNAVENANRSVLDITGGNVKHVADILAGMTADQVPGMYQNVDPSKGNEAGQLLFNTIQHGVEGNPYDIQNAPGLKRIAEGTPQGGIANWLARATQTGGEDIGGMALNPNTYNPSRMIQGLQAGEMLTGLGQELGTAVGKDDYSPETLAHLLPLALGAFHFGKGGLEGISPENSLVSEKQQENIPNVESRPRNIIDIEGQKSTTFKDEPNTLGGFPETPEGADLSNLDPLDIPFHPETDFSKSVNINDLHNPLGQMNAGFDFNELPARDKVKNLGPVPEMDLSKDRLPPENFESDKEFRDRMMGLDKTVDEKALADLTRHPATEHALADLAEIHGTSNPNRLASGYFHDVFSTDNPDTVIRASTKPYGPGEKAVEWPDSKYVIKPKETQFAGGKQIDVLPAIKKIVRPTPEQVADLNAGLAKEGKYTLADPEGSGGNLTVIGGKARVVDPGALVPIDVAKNYEANKGLRTPEAFKARQDMQNYIRRAGFDLEQGYKSNADEVMKDLEERGLGDLVPSEVKKTPYTSKQKRQLSGEPAPIKVNELFDPETGELLSGGEKKGKIGPYEHLSAKQQIDLVHKGEKPAFYLDSDSATIDNLESYAKEKNLPYHVEDLPSGAHDIMEIELPDNSPEMVKLNIDHMKSMGAINVHQEGNSIKGIYPKGELGSKHIFVGKNAKSLAELRVAGDSTTTGKALGYSDADIQAFNEQNKLPDFPKTPQELVQESLGKIRAESKSEKSVPTPVSTSPLKASSVLDTDLTTETGSGRGKGRPPNNRQFGNKPPNETTSPEQEVRPYRVRLSNDQHYTIKATSRQEAMDLVDQKLEQGGYKVRSTQAIEHPTRLERAATAEGEFESKMKESKKVSGAIEAGEVRERTRQENQSFKEQTQLADKIESEQFKESERSSKFVQRVKDMSAREQAREIQQEAKAQIKDESKRAKFVKDLENAVKREQAKGIRDEAKAMEKEYREKIAKGEREEFTHNPVVKVMNAVKSLAFGGDVGHLLRQGKQMNADLLLSFSPAKWKQFAGQFPVMFKAMKSEKWTKAFHENLYADPDIRRMVDDFKLDMPGVGKQHLKEEIFHGGGLAESLPVVGKYYAKPSEQLYTTGLNYLRASVIKNEVSNLRKRGFTMDGSPERYRGIARAVNIISQRGDFSPAYQKAFSDASVFLSAPRAKGAKLQNIFSGDLVKNTEAGRVERRAALKTIAFNAAMFAILKAKYGDDIKFIDDPERSDFLNFRVGNHTIDPWMGLGPTFRTAMKLYYGKTISGSTGKTRQISVPQAIGEEFMNGIAPGVAMIWTAASGKDTRGFPTDRWKALENIIPLPLRSAKEIFEESGWDGLLLAISDNAGQQVNTYNPQKAKAEQDRLKGTEKKTEKKPGSSNKAYPSLFN